MELEKTYASPRAGRTGGTRARGFWKPGGSAGRGGADVSGDARQNRAGWDELPARPSGRRGGLPRPPNAVERPPWCPPALRLRPGGQQDRDRGLARGCGSPVTASLREVRRRRGRWRARRRLGGSVAECNFEAIDRAFY